MTSTDTAHGSRSTAGARLRRTLLVVAGVVVVAVPILVGLVLAWQVHWLLVAPAYLLGIPVWLTVVSGAWALVRRLRPAADASATAAAEEPAAEEPAAEEPAAQVAPTAPPAPVIRTELRMPAPRTEGAGVRTPTP